MKPLLFGLSFFLLFGYSTPTFGQSVALKGRVGFVFYPTGYAASNAIGLEYTFNKKLSASFLASHTFLSSVVDGPSYTLAATTLELKYFFNETEGFNTGTFISTGIGRERFRILPGGEEIDPVTGTAINLSPHIALGRNFQLTEKWYLEVYVGGKYGFPLSSENILFVGNFQKWGFENIAVRGGINIGFVLF